MICTKKFIFIWEDGYTREYNVYDSMVGTRHGENIPINAKILDGGKKVLSTHSREAELVKEWYESIPKYLKSGYTDTNIDMKLEDIIDYD